MKNRLEAGVVVPFEIHRHCVLNALDCDHTHLPLSRRRRDRNAARSTHATMTHFAMPFPDWNSLDSVRRAHNDLEVAALIFFALLVVFDVLAHFSEDIRKEKLFEKIGLCFFGIAVLAEIVAYPYGQRNDDLSARVIGSLDVKAQRAADNASKALTDSSTAVSHARDAADVASIAKGEADQVTGIAIAARSTADNAKAGAADAGRQVSDLQAQAKSLKSDIAAEEEELKRLNSPRTLTNSADIVERLQKFKGTEYTFPGVFNNEDSIQFLLAIDGVLQQAGWNRVAPPKVGTLELFGLPVFGANGPMLSETSGSGVQISVEVPAGTYKTVDEMPSHVRAAVELNRLLFSGMYPPEPEGKDKRPSAKEGRSRTVQILVGSKRLGANAKANAQKTKAK